MRKFRCIIKEKFKTDFILNENSFKCEDGKYRYLYKIDFPNGKYYLGKHTTKKLNDGYGGSGCLLPKEYAHNDIKDTKKIILKFLTSSNELDSEEEKLISELYLSDENCLNYCKGGSGGCTETMARKISKAKKGKKRPIESIEKQRIKCIGRFHTEETKKKQSEWHKKFWVSDEGYEQRKKMSELMSGRKVSNEMKDKLSKISKKRFENKNFMLKHKLTSYYFEINNHVEYDYIIKLLKKDSYTNEEYIYLQNLLESFKIKREEIKKLLKVINDKYKEKYVFTDEHKKNLSESKKGWKPEQWLREQWSKNRSGRGNSRYCNDTILMLDIKSNDIIKEFYDCIEAVEYVKENINEKANGGEIFVACRENRIRYNHKWKQIKK